MAKFLKRILILLGIITVVPIVLVCAIVALAYHPPVQKWLINEVGTRMEEQLGMRVHVDDVRITPFLDLVAEGVSAVDADGDTLVNAQDLTFDIAFAPLLEGRADVDGFVLGKTQLNTKGLIADCSIVGTVGHLGADAHGIAWNDELVHINTVNLRDANLFVALTDTATKDTTSAPLKWIIDVDKASISHTHINAYLPPDSVGHTTGIDAYITNAEMQGGHFDLGQPYYAFRQLQLLDSRASMSCFAAVPYQQTVPADTLFSLYNLRADVDSLSYDSCGVLRCGVNHVAFDESKYNLHIREIAGRVYMDSVRLEVPALNFHTLNSRINASLALEWEALKAGSLGSIHVGLDAAIASQDIHDALRIAAQERFIDASLLTDEYFRPFINSDYHIKAHAHGNLKSIIVDDYDLAMLSTPFGGQILASKGNLRLSDDFRSFSGRISADVNTANDAMRRMITAVLRDVDPSLPKQDFVRPLLSSRVSLSTAFRGNLQHITLDDYSINVKSQPSGAEMISSKGHIDLSDGFKSFAGHVSASVNTANHEVNTLLRNVLGSIDKTLPTNEYIKPLLSARINLSTGFQGNLHHIAISDYNISATSVPHGGQIMSAKGDLDVSDDFQAYRGSISSNILGGAIDARFNTHLQRETYDVEADVRNFPLDRFVSGYDLKPFTGHLEARGQGFDPTSIRSNLTTKIRAQQLKVMGYDLSGLLADISLRGGKALADIALSNYLGRIKGSIEAALGKGYDATAHLTLDDLNMRKLCGIKDTLTLSTVLDVHATASDDFKRITAEGSVRQNHLVSPRRSAELKDIEFAFSTSPSFTKADVDAGDLCLDASFHGDLDYISRSGTRFVNTLMAQLDNKAIDQEALRRVMPSASIKLHAGTDNPLHNFLYFQGTELASIDLDLTTSPTRGINGTANLGTLVMGNLQLDTIYANIAQDDEGIKLRGTIHNYLADNPHRFTASVDGRLQERGFESLVLFEDEEGKKGIDLGVRAETYQGTARFTIYPQNPVFAYRSFTINEDNFISINRQGMIRADVHLVADDGTGLLVYSEPTDERTNDVTLSVYNLNLKELCDVMPYMPAMSGTVNGDFHVIEEHGEAGSIATAGPLPGYNLSAMGTVEAKEFAYEGTVIGDLGAELVYMPKENGEHYADAFVSYNGMEVGECSGVYYDTNGQFKGDIALNEFPLQMVNAFLDGTDFMMRGNVGGTFSAHGSIDSPVMNGEINFADAHFYSLVYGVDFKMEESPIVFADSRLEFDDYTLSSGSTDLKINGNVNMTDLSRIRLDLSMATRNFELINTMRTPTSLVYGKLMANYDGTVRGTIDNIAVRGQLDVLPTTDLTYLLTNSPLTVDDRLSDLVTFMDFSDTTTVELPVDVSHMLYDVTLGVNISDGAKFHCFLSSNGKSYVDVQGGGNLTLRTSQEGDMRLIGRYTIQNGRMNYELPVIPMKTFELAQGSYVEFSGDMMNPRLNIQATQEAKAVVSDDDGQRTVAFVVGVDITRTLDDMGLAFTIDAPEDLSVQNQLATMSEEDRYKTAVALLATGMYVTENLSTGLKASNALNAFLQNEIQNIAGKALATFDLSFGMENGTSSTGAMTTDYSFKFSKRFLDDRISINIGGSVSTGQNAQNNAASFIDNISIEYRLDNSSTRYVRVFYDRDSHDPLEGSMMKTGAGLVLRRKTDRLGELFIFHKRQSRKAPYAATAAPVKPYEPELPEAPEDPALPDSTAVAPAPEISDSTHTSHRK